MCVCIEIRKRDPLFGNRCAPHLHFGALEVFETQVLQVTTYNISVLRVPDIGEQYKY